MSKDQNIPRFEHTEAVQSGLGPGFLSYLSDAFVSTYDTLIRFVFPKSTPSSGGVSFPSQLGTSSIESHHNSLFYFIRQEAAIALIRSNQIKPDLSFS